MSTSGLVKFRAAANWVAAGFRGLASRQWLVAVSVSALASPIPASAHHSFAMFDRSLQITLLGTIKAYQWTNPHVFLQLLVKKESGADEEWSIEGASPNMLYRDGWTNTTFRIGDKVTLVANPLRDHGHGGYFLFCRFEDGRTVGKLEQTPPG